MQLEYALVVVVEADDRAAPHENAGILDAVDLLQRRAVAIGEVLDFLGFAQRFLIRRLNADEHRVDISVDQEPHHLLVLGEVDRCLGDKADRIAVRLLPPDDLAQNRLYRLLIADQIVVDDEGVVDAGGGKPIQLGPDLLRGLEPRPPPKNDDDVAKFTGERAAARHLQAAIEIAVHPPEVPARARHGGHVALVRLLVARLVAALAPFGEKARPRLLRLANEHHIDETAEILGADRHPRTAKHREDIAALQLRDDPAHPVTLHRHAGYADDIGARATLVIYLFDILIDDRHTVPGRGQGGERRQVERRHQRLLAEQRQRVIEAPIGRVEPRTDQN